MSAQEHTVTEVAESLTGFDEIAIEKSFGAALDELKPTMAGRALVFVVERRAGKDDGAAKNAAMSMPIGEVNAYFAEEPDDVIPDEPDSDSGKDA